MNHCKICQHKQLRVIEIPKKGIIYYSCPNCLYIAIDDEFVLSETDEKQRYDLHENNSNNSQYVAIFENFIQHAIEPRAHLISRILDFGSGPEPVLAQLLKGRGFEVDLYDKFYHTDDSFTQKKYDLICSTEVVEHLTDPMPVFQELKSCLKPGAFLAVMTRFHRNDDVFFYNWHYRREDTHVGVLHSKTIDILSECLDMKLIYRDDKEIFVLALK